MTEDEKAAVEQYDAYRANADRHDRERKGRGKLDSRRSREES